WRGSRGWRLAVQGSADTQQDRAVSTRRKLRVHLDEAPPGELAIAEEQVHTANQRALGPAQLSPDFDPVQKEDDMRAPQPEEWQQFQKRDVPDHHYAGSPRSRHGAQDRLQPGVGVEPVCRCGSVAPCVAVAEQPEGTERPIGGPNRVPGQPATRLDATQPAPPACVSSARFACELTRTGTPQDSASTTTSPKFSWCEGSASTAAPRSTANFSAPATQPVNTTRSPPDCSRAMRRR